MSTEPARPPRHSLALAVGPVFVVVLAFAGQIKAHPLLIWLPVDMTLLAAVAVVVLCVISRAQLGPANGWVWLPLALWVVFLPAVSLSPLDDRATTKVVTLFTVTFLLALAPFYLLRTPEQRRVFLWAVVVVAVFAAVWALLVEPTYASDYTNRLLLEGTDTIGTARIAMAGAVVLVVFAVGRSHRAVFRLVLVAGAAVMAFLAFSTGSRGPVLAGGVALLLVVIIAPMFSRYRGRAIVALLAVGAIAVWVAAANAGDGFTRVLALLLGENDSSTSSRTYLWGLASSDAAAKPLGAGWGSWSASHGRHTYPHNLPLELAVEAGWLVALAVVCVLGASIVRAARQAVDTTSTAMLGLLIFAALNAMVSSDINGSRLLWAVMFAAWSVRTVAASPAESGTAPRRLQRQ